MYKSNREAFTMIEIVFVIVVIGILSAIAIPKFAATRDDALITKGKAILASVRSSIAIERQKRILRGDFKEITALNAGSGVFSSFSADSSGKKNDVLEYPVKASSLPGGWKASGKSYVFYYSGGSCTYTLGGNKLTGSCPVFGN